MQEHIPEPTDPSDSEELLRRALLDEASAVTVSLRIDGLPVIEAVTVIFYARRDLGTLQTYLTPGGYRGRLEWRRRQLMRVPSTSTSATPRIAGRPNGCTPSRRGLLRDAVLSADIVLDVWREPLLGDRRPATSWSTIRSTSPVRLPVPRLLPTALVAPNAQIVVTPVCSARTLAEGRPPLGIACAQQDLARIYRLSDDPERCVEDFLEQSATHAHGLAERIAHQEASVERFLELSDAA